MIKNILSVLIFLFSLFFFYLVGSIYFSDHHEKKVKKNREIIFKKIKNNISELPILVNDSNNIIEFNTDFENDNTLKKRNFWKLFKKND